MTILRAYMMNTLCTIQVYSYLPKKFQVFLHMSLILEHNETRKGMIKGK